MCVPPVVLSVGYVRDAGKALWFGLGFFAHNIMIQYLLMVHSEERVVGVLITVGTI